MKKIELFHSTVLLQEDGILELHASNDHVYTIKDVIENVDAFGQLTSNQKAPVLIIGGSLVPKIKIQEAFWLLKNH